MFWPSLLRYLFVRYLSHLLCNKRFADDAKVRGKDAERLVSVVPTHGTLCWWSSFLFLSGQNFLCWVASASAPLRGVLYMSTSICPRHFFLFVLCCCFFQPQPKKPPNRMSVSKLVRNPRFTLKASAARSRLRGRLRPLKSVGVFPPSEFQKYPRSVKPHRFGKICRCSVFLDCVNHSK